MYYALRTLLFMSVQMYVHICACSCKCSVWIYNLGVTVGYKMEEHHNCLLIYKGVLISP